VPTLEAEDDLAERPAGAPRALSLHGAARLELPEHVVSAARAAVVHSPPRMSSRGLPELRRAVAEWIRFDVDPEREVLVTYGAMQALSICFRALLKAGDRVLVPAPCFYFGTPIRLAAGEPVYVPTRLENSWRLDLEAAETAAADRRVRAIVLCNPVNPTGHLLRRGELEAVVELAMRRDLLIVSDESYERYVYDGGALESVLSVPGARERTVLVRSMSKSFGLASWRVGFLIAPGELLDPCVQLFEWDGLRGNPVAHAAAAAAIAGPQDWLAGIVPQYERNRALAIKAVAAAELACAWPDACPFVFVDILPLGSDGAARLVNAGVPAVDGRHFQGRGYARIPFGGDAADVRALHSVLRRLRNTDERVASAEAG
jgi:aspartate/methionine/tyrosine aminotransferase